MQLQKPPILLRLIGLFACLTSGCQSADLSPNVRPSNAATSSLSACQKADAMWNDKIIPSRYDQLPPLTSPGIFDLLKLATSRFSVKALTNEGDELEKGRRKLIHAFGTEARLRLVIASGAAGGYTGIFQSGAECMIGRFSLVSKPTTDKSIPALALKIFIDGDQPSVNLLLMHSVDGQAGHNYFAQTFSNILPQASSFSTRLLAGVFERSAVQFGAKDTNPGRLTLEHLSGIQTDGKHIPAPQTPYQLRFKPTAQAHALMQHASAEDDFRVKLDSLHIGQAVYDIFILAEGDSPENARFLGQLVLASSVVSSHYGDEKLFFRHNMARNEGAPSIRD